MHSYSSGSFASERARNWLKRMEVGCDTPENVALRMEGFAVSGLNERVKKTQDCACWFLTLWYLTLTYSTWQALPVQRSCRRQSEVNAGTLSIRVLVRHFIIYSQCHTNLKPQSKFSRPRIMSALMSG